MSRTKYIRPSTRPRRRWARYRYFCIRERREDKHDAMEHRLANHRNWVDDQDGYQFTFGSWR